MFFINVLLINMLLLSQKAWLIPQSCSLYIYVQSSLVAT